MFTLQDFNRWLEYLAATGLKPVDPAEIERIRAILKAGGTMTTPEPA